MFKDHQTHKSKMSQGEEEGGEEGNEVHLGLPFGRQKSAENISKYVRTLLNLFLYLLIKVNHRSQGQVYVHQLEDLQNYVLL